MILCPRNQLPPTYVTQFVLNALGQISQGDVMYTDSSEAFNKLNHKVILGKLRMIRFHNDFICFM